MTHDFPKPVPVSDTEQEVRDRFDAIERRGTGRASLRCIGAGLYLTDDPDGWVFFVRVDAGRRLFVPYASAYNTLGALARAGNDHARELLGLFPLEYRPNK